ncbi:uncharacterized protein LOC132313121 [Cornus florida]|uniref:uncharacterized protein LOC132313121 n=1 Tax=Cornus florida TaxID=4283 RepID=UPI0028A1BE4C|nr:uncharacterized protein LOC132313121 [Cornus florida]
MDHYPISYDGTYDNVGYGEPLQSQEDKSSHDYSNSSSDREEESGLTSRPWNNKNELTKQAYEYDGSGNLLGILQSYFGGSWGEDLLSHGYGNNGYDTELEKAEDPQQGEVQHGSYYIHDSDMEMQPAYDYNSSSCYGSGFEYGGEEDYHGYGMKEPVPAYSYPSNEMGHCESLFGHWPFSSRQDQESYVEQGLA